MNGEPGRGEGGRLEPDGGRRSGRTDPSVDDTGLERNVAAALSYVLLFISGIAMYVLEDDEFVRFHAAQSIVVFGALAVANVVIGSLFVALGSIAALLNGLVSLVTLALWVFLIVTAYQGQTRRIPVAAGIADSLASGTGGSSRSSSGYGGTEKANSRSEDSDALETLRERYAQGKLGDEEFERKLERLLEDEHRESTGRREYERSERSR